MDNKELYLYRIMMGYFLCNIEGQAYKITNPTPHILYQAEHVKTQCIAANIYEQWPTDKLNKHILIKHGFVDKSIDDNFEIIHKRIEDLKVELYDSTFQSDKQKNIRKILNKAKSKSNEMWHTRHMFDHTTLEGYANLVRHQFIIYSTLYYPDDTRVYVELEEVGFSLIDKVIQEIFKHSITETEFRFIARNEPWRSIWCSNRTDVYGKPSIELSSEQRQLILMSKMYDSAHEHPDCPSDNIMEDDDMFDGWMIKNRKEKEKQQNIQNMDSTLGGRHQNAHEVFIPITDEKGLPSSNPEDIKKIEDLNDIEAKIVKKQRATMIKKKGRVEQSKLPDERTKIAMEANQQFRDKIKGNK